MATHAYDPRELAGAFGSLGTALAGRCCFGSDEAGREILHPVAVTIFGGLLSATLLDTVLTPVLFLSFGKKPLERLAAGQVGAPAPAEAF